MNTVLWNSDLQHAVRSIVHNRLASEPSIILSRNEQKAIKEIFTNTETTDSEVWVQTLWN